MERETGGFENTNYDEHVGAAVTCLCHLCVEQLGAVVLLSALLVPDS